MLARGASRAVVRVARARPSRGFAAQADNVYLGNPTKEWLEKQASVEHHAEGMLFVSYLYIHYFLRVLNQKPPSCGAKSGMHRSC